MNEPLLACPLCSQPGFPTLESLRDSLIGAASRQIVCPVCHDVLHGLDKFTIHLFSHFLQYNIEALAQKYNDSLKCNALPSHPVNLSLPKDAAKPLEHLHLSYGNREQNINTVGSDQVVNICPVVTNQIEVDSLIQCQPSTTAVHHEPMQDVFVSNDTKSNDYDAESNFENVALLESCGLKQNELGLMISEAAAESPAKGPSGEDLKCQLCDFTFPDAHILVLHKQLVHDGKEGAATGGGERKPFGCYLCTKEFKMRGSLMVHLRVAHGGGKVAQSGAKEADAEARQFVCATCGKSFKKDQHLNQHMKTHEGKQWACDVCHKMFTTKYFLKKHKRLHTGEMPYSCSICNKTFTFQQSMHKHALYHRDDKPHECVDCNRSFKELSTLHNHRRIHTGEKPFSCETCGKCFRQRVSYLVHRRIHTGVTPYKCTACGKSFRYKVSERTHKCPSQPPGTVVRQPGDLVQKLQQRAAQFVIVLEGGAASGQTVLVAHEQGGGDASVGPGGEGNGEFNQAQAFGHGKLIKEQSVGCGDAGISHNAEDVSRELAQTFGKSGRNEVNSVMPNLGSVQVFGNGSRDFNGIQSYGGRKLGQVQLDELRNAQSNTVGCGNVEGKDLLGVFEGSSTSVGRERTKRRHRKSLANGLDNLDLIVETADFFSMVEGLPSPSERLRNLSISSPTAFAGGEERSQLQTINEESLKQLLYGSPL